MAIEVGTAYISILPSTSKLAPALKKDMAGIEKSLAAQGAVAGASFGTRFRAGAVKFLKRGLFAGAAGASLLAGAGIKTAAELEQSKIGFETMLGSAKKADAFLNKIKDTAKRTPFELSGLTQSTQKLMAMGFSAQDVIPTLTTLGDAAAGLGLGQEGLDRIVLAIGQMQAKGKVSGEEIRQLTEAGIPATRILQNELNLTKDEYETLQRQGKITAEQAIPALLNGIDKGTKGIAGQTQAFGGLMEKQSHSLTGLFSNLKDEVLVGMADAITPLIPLIKDGLAGAISAAGPACTVVALGLRGIIAVLSPLGNLLAEHTPLVKAVAAGATAAATAYGVYTAATKLAAVATALLSKSFALSPVGMVVTAIGLLAAGFVLAYQKSETFRKIVDKVWDVLRNKLGPVLSGVKSLLTGQVGPAFQWLGTKVVGPVFAFIASRVSAAWNTVRGKFTAWVGFMRGTLGPAVKWLWSSVVQPVFSSVTSKISAAWNTVRGKLSAWVSYTRGTLGTAIRWLWSSVVQPVFSNVMSKVSAAWNAVHGKLAAWVSYVRGPLSSGIRALWSHVVQPTFTSIVSKVSSAWNTIHRALDAMRHFIADTLGPQVRKAMDGIGNAFQKTRDAAKAPAKFLIETVYNDGIRKLIGKLPGVSEPAAIHPGFATGGWTGPGSKFQPAGIVHADEFVLSKRARRSLEAAQPGALDRMNRTGQWPGYAGGGRVWPVPGHIVGTYAGHDGVDINAPGEDYGHPIWAAAGGTISYVGTGHGYGLATFITGPYGTVVYGHMSRAYGHAGQQVSAGTLIGRVGSTGHSTGPHLHFGFPGGTTGMALAFLQGASVKGGSWSSGGGEKSVGGSFISEWKDAIKGIKDMIGKVKGWVGDLSGKGPGWGPLLAQSAKGMANSAVKWLNDKIPNRFLPDNPIPGFACGGYTGTGSRAAVAGLVHADEYVIRSASRRKIEEAHPGLLAALNRTGTLPGLAKGGKVKKADKKKAEPKKSGVQPVEKKAKKGKKGGGGLAKIGAPPAAPVASPEELFAQAHGLNLDDWPNRWANGHSWPSDTADRKVIDPCPDKGHIGFDLGTPMGSRIHAVLGGKVSYYGGRYKRYGKSLIVDTPAGRMLYGHLMIPRVKQGQQVRTGQDIATAGRENRLHFAVLQKTNSDMLAFLRGWVSKDGRMMPPGEARALAAAAAAGEGEADDLAEAVEAIEAIAPYVRTQFLHGSLRELVAGVLSDTSLGSHMGVASLSDIWKRTGVFDNGGILAPGMLAYNASNKPEAVFNHEQFRKYANDRERSGARRDAPLVENLTLQSTGNTHEDMNEVNFQLRRLERSRTRYARG